MARKISVMFLSAILIFILGGCQMIRIEEGEVSPVEYTVVSQEDVPGEGISAYLSERRGSVSDQRLWKADDGRVQYCSGGVWDYGKGSAF